MLENCMTLTLNIIQLNCNFEHRFVLSLNLFVNTQPPSYPERVQLDGVWLIALE